MNALSYLLAAAVLVSPLTAGYCGYRLIAYLRSVRFQRRGLGFDSLENIWAYGRRG